MIREALGKVVIFYASPITFLSDHQHVLKILVAYF